MNSIVIVLIKRVTVHHECSSFLMKIRLNILRKKYVGCDKL